MSAARDQEIARYVDEVRRELADLPPETRNELLEDLPEHLAEVAAEADGPLADRLGEPQAYATELRTAAGFGPHAEPPRLDRRIGGGLARVRARLRTLDARVGPTIGYGHASDFLRLLRPAWWILRGYLAAMLLTVVLTGDSPGLLPRLGGSTLAALLLLAATVAGSIWLGRHTGRFGRWPRLTVNVATGLIVLFGLVGFVELDDRARSDGFSYQPAYNGDPYSNVQDVYVYDSQGRLLEGVRLFDQNGQPIRLGYPWCPQAQDVTGDPIRAPYPYCPQGAPFRFSAPGVPVGPGEAPPRNPVPGEPFPSAPVPVPTPTGTGSPAPVPPPSVTASPGSPESSTAPVGPSTQHEQPVSPSVSG